MVVAQSERYGGERGEQDFDIAHAENPVAAGHDVELVNGHRVVDSQTRAFGVKEHGRLPRVIGRRHRDSAREALL